MLNRMLHTFKVGDTVELQAHETPGPRTGTVTQVTKRKVRVLFPVHKYLWLYPSAIAKVKAA